MRRKKQRGQAIVEGALTLLTFVALLIGILDFGQVIYFHQTLTERARAAARYGAVNPNATSAIQNVAVFNAASADGRTAVLPNLTTANVAVSLQGVNTSAARVTVTISNYPIQFYSPYLPRSFNVAPISVTVSSEAP